LLRHVFLDLATPWRSYKKKPTNAPNADANCAIPGGQRSLSAATAQLPCLNLRRTTKPPHSGFLPKECQASGLRLLPALTRANPSARATAISRLSGGLIFLAISKIAQW
jgi:hypothetical protein